MKNALLSSLREASWIRTIVGIFAMTLVIVFASADSLIRVYREQRMLDYDYHTNLILTALSSDTVAPFLPILAVLPFSAGYIDNVKSKFARFFLIRTSYRTYLLSRCAVCFLLGGLVPTLGTLLCWGGGSLVFLPMEYAPKSPSEVPAMLLKECGLLFLSGGMWAVAGMAMSTLMESKYIAYASPFVIYYLMVILYERYLPKCFLIYPREWIAPSKLWPFGAWGPAVLMLELSLLFTLLFYFRAERRLRQL